MDEPRPTVYVVDDDPAVLRALARLLASAELQVATSESSRDFLERFDPAAPGCLVLDLAMPGLDGLQLQQALAERGAALPIIFLTGRGDVPSSVRAMKHGAVDFLTKPVHDEDLLAAVHEAFERDRAARRLRQEQAAINQRLATLTPREREVLPYVLAGRLNKQVAADLGTVEKTIKVHRSRIMHKLGVRSLAELVRLAEHAGIPPAARKP